MEQGIFASLLRGQAYSSLPKVVFISIADFSVFDSDEWHTKDFIFDNRRFNIMYDKLEMHYFEIRKMPQRINPDSDLELILSLFRAKDEEDLKNLELMEIEILDDAIEAYREITASDIFRERERLREKALHDEAQA